MPIVTDPELFGFGTVNLRGRKPKGIPEGCFPISKEWNAMGFIEKDNTHINLLKAVRATALWEIDLPLLAPALTELQLKEYEDPSNSIANLTSGINGLVGTWFHRNFGIPRTATKLHASVCVRRFENADDDLIVRAFIIKHVPVGTKTFVDNLNNCGVGKAFF